MPDFAVIIPSANADNLVPCVRAVQEKDPGVEIVVVNDGARERAEPQISGVRWIEGEKPFIFARAINQGINYADGRDVVLLNDDALLETPGGLTTLARVAKRASQVSKTGIVAAAVRGVVGNRLQKPRRVKGIRFSIERLCFVCVAIPTETVRRVGLLDEQFVGYGGDDRDYCKRAQLEGLYLAVYDGCVVEHSTVLRPTFRSNRETFRRLELQGRRIYERKWNEFPYSPHMIRNARGAG